MSFNCGWQAGGFFAVYIFVVSFVVNFFAQFLFGDHTLVQTGLETAIFATLSASVYTLGYYMAKRKYSDMGLITHVVFSGLAMLLIGSAMHASVAAMFTSTFFLVVYAIVAMFMAWLGYEDQRSESYMQYLEEHGMA